MKEVKFEKFSLSKFKKLDSVKRGLSVGGKITTTVNQTDVEVRNDKDSLHDNVKGL